MDISGPMPFGAHAISATRIPEEKPPEVTRVNQPENSGKPGANPDHTRDPKDSALAARDLDTLRHSRIDPDFPAGPPPSFEISLLEVDSELKLAMARIEVSRSHDETHAFQPDSTPEPAPAPVSANQPAERVAVMLLEQPYDAPAHVKQADTGQDPA